MGTAMGAHKKTPMKSAGDFCSQSNLPQLVRCKNLSIVSPGHSQNILVSLKNAEEALHVCPQIHVMV